MTQPMAGPPKLARGLRLRGGANKREGTIRGDQPQFAPEIPQPASTAIVSFAAISMRRDSDGGREEKIRAETRGRQLRRQTVTSPAELSENRPKALGCPHGYRADGARPIGQAVGSQET